MPFDPREKWLETIFLCSPEQSFPIFRVIAVLFVAMLAKGRIVEETFAADPAHYWWRGNSEAVHPGLRVITVGAGAHALPISRHSVCSQLDVIAATFLGKELLATVAFEICQQTESWSEQHRAFPELGRRQ